MGRLWEVAGLLGVAVGVVAFPRDAFAVCDKDCDIQWEVLAEPPLICSQVAVHWGDCGCNWGVAIQNHCTAELEVLDLKLANCGDLHAGPEGCTFVPPDEVGSRGFPVNSDGRIERPFRIDDDDGEHEVRAVVTVSNFRIPTGCQLASAEAPAWPLVLGSLPLLVWVTRRKRRELRPPSECRPETRRRSSPPAAHSPSRR